MNKLGNKEVILILVVINILCYYFLWIMGIGPIKTKIGSNNEEIKTLQAEYDEKKAIVDSEQEYIDTIERLKAEKAELFESGFPNTNAENLHAFMNKEATTNSVTLSNITITQSPRTVVDASGENFETGIMDNTITLNATGNYGNITKLIAAIEDVQKTSILTSLNLSGTAGEMTTTMSYSFLSADKSENPDAVFDHTFGQAAGNTALFR